MAGIFGGMGISPYSVQQPGGQGQLSQYPGYAPAAQQPSEDIWSQLDRLMAAEPMDTTNVGLSTIEKLGAALQEIGPMVGDFADASQPRPYTTPGFVAPGGQPNVGPGIYGMQALLNQIAGGR